MKKKIIALLGSLFSKRRLVRDFHQLLLMTAAGGLIAFLFSEAHLPLWSLGAVAAMFLFGVIIAEWEE